MEPGPEVASINVLYCDGDENHVKTVRTQAVAAAQDFLMWQTRGASIHVFTQISSSPTGIVEPNQRSCTRDARRQATDLFRRVMQGKCSNKQNTRCRISFSAQTLRLRSVVLQYLLEETHDGESQRKQDITDTVVLLLEKKTFPVCVHAILPPPWWFSGPQTADPPTPPTLTACIIVFLPALSRHMKSGGAWDQGKIWPKSTFNNSWVLSSLWLL